MSWPMFVRVVTPDYYMIDCIHKCDWLEFYQDAKEGILVNAQEPQDKGVHTCMFVDSDCAKDKVSCRSRSGFVTYMNTVLVQWFYNKQSTVKTSLSGTVFIAIKRDINALRGLRYNFLMMPIPISGPLYIYGDNMSAVHSTSRPESLLRKKSNSVCYHALHESVAMGESLVGHIPSKENIADLMTKVLYGTWLVVFSMIFMMTIGHKSLVYLGGTIKQV